MATSPVSTVLLSAHPGKDFNQQLKMLKTSELRSFQLLLGVSRRPFRRYRAPGVVRLVKLLRNHLCNADTACRSHCSPQRLHRHSHELVFAGVCVTIVVSTGK
jgi:hypothetical protein